MSNVSRVVAVWSGFLGEPGYTKFSFMPLVDDTARNAAGAAVRTFFEALKGYIPNGVTITVQPVVDDLDIVNGELMSSGVMTSAPSPTVSTATADIYAGGSGFCITWLSGVVFNGRRAQGRTFIVPARAPVFATNGTLDAGLITAATAAGTALIGTAGADLAIWQRQWTKDTPPVSVAGSLASATACVVRDHASQLRTRR